MLPKETGEIQFAISVETVAKSVLEPDFKLEDALSHWAIGKQLPILRDIMATTQPSIRGSISYPMEVIPRFIKESDKKIKDGVSHGIVWTVAAAILIEPEMFSDFSELQVRCLLDTAVEYDINSWQRIQGKFEIENVYKGHQIPKHPDINIEGLRKLQTMLRERVPESTNVERK